MKPMNILIYLAMIAVFEGALHEYLCSTTTQAYRGSYRTVQHRIPETPKKESVSAPLKLRRTGHGWCEMFMSMMHSLWALLIGIARWIWHGVREWIELVLMAFECSELVHKFTGRLSWWDGPYS